MLAFSGYQDWCEYDDDGWTTNCLGQVLDDGVISAYRELLIRYGLHNLKE